MNFATSKERLLQYLDKKDISTSTFLRDTGIKRGFLDGDKLKSTISDIFLARIIAVYEDLDVEWLITGKGSMLKEKKVKTYNLQEPQTEVASEPEMTYYKLRTDYFGVNRQRIPLYEVDGAAGLTTLFVPDNRQYPLDYIDVPNAPKCDGAIFVRGDSMYPILKSGDIVCYKTVFSIESIYYGEMYLLDVDMDGDQYLTFKYIQKSDLGDDYITLASHNPHHASKDILKSEVRALALVKLSIRYNTNS